MVRSEDRFEYAFFDLETTKPTQPGQECIILEFGAILVCPSTLVELDAYSNLVRPADLSSIAFLPMRSNGINRDTVASSPTFQEIADEVYDILHGLLLSFSFSCQVSSCLCLVAEKLRTLKIWILFNEVIIMLCFVFLVQTL